jgi:hypothetical protein
MPQLEQPQPQGISLLHPCIATNANAKITNNNLMKVFREVISDF